MLAVNSASCIIIPSPESAKLPSLANRWARDCEDGHRHCKTYRSEARRSPRRILEIEDTRVLVRDLPETGWQGEYITLSHRWTVSKSPKLRRSHADELWSQAAATGFQDATLVAR